MYRYVVSVTYPAQQLLTFTQNSNKPIKESKSRKLCYLCAVCNKLFCFKYELIRHQRSHTGERPFKCNECNKCFNYNSALLEHKRVHSGEKPYECTACNMCFRQKSTLNRHKRTHTGEKPFRCELCNKCFTQRSSLTWHTTLHSGESPFYCSKCNQYFSRRGTLVKHNKTKHLSQETYISARNKPEKCLQSEQCLVNRSTLDTKMKDEQPDEVETSLEMLVRSSDILNDLNEQTE